MHVFFGEEDHLFPRDGDDVFLKAAGASEFLFRAIGIGKIGEDSQQIVLWIKDAELAVGVFEKCG